MRCVLDSLLFDPAATEQTGRGRLTGCDQRGQHWADPLKAWGDVLAKQGKTKDALAKYDEAFKFAPNWKQRKEAREAAAKATR
jgi:hypothetical protein